MNNVTHQMHRINKKTKIRVRLSRGPMHCTCTIEPHGAIALSALKNNHCNSYKYFLITYLTVFDDDV